MLAATGIVLQVLPSPAFASSRPTEPTVDLAADDASRRTSSASDSESSHTSVTFHASFDESIHGSSDALAPYAAGGNLELVPARGGQPGHVRFNGNLDSSRAAALIYDGRNLDPRAGTLSFDVRWSGSASWDDGRRTWLAVLVPLVGERGMATNEQGTSLAIIKDETNHLSLALHQFHDGRLNAEYAPPKDGFVSLDRPDDWVIRIPVEDLDPAAWTHVQIGWDRKQQKVWLSVGDAHRQSPATLRPTTYRALILGSPPRIRWGPRAGFDGDMDELRISSESPTDEADRTTQAPRNPRRSSSPNLETADLDSKREPRPHSVEATARRHLHEIVASQRNGGWAYSVAIPSHMRFLDQHTLIPFSDRVVAASKGANSAWIGLILMAAYDVFGDPSYLAAARATGDVLLAAQLPSGHFPAMFFVDEDGGVRIRHRPDIALIEDHVQTHPILLLWQLDRYAGDHRYAEAADRALKLVVDAQNASGSWPHHFRLDKQIGSSVSGALGGGEINDYATTDPMRLMLLAYRRTGDKRYLARYLAAADWLRDAFIDGPAKGWASQYDAENKPVEARHFEPAAISLTEGAAAVPIELHRAAEMTGDISYQKPASIFVRWLEATRTTEGWLPYYEPETGRPITMTHRKISTASIRDASDFEMSEVLRKLARKPGQSQKSTPDAATRARHDAAGELSLLKRVDDESGLWVNSGGPTGKLFGPSSNRVLVLLRGISARKENATPPDSKSPFQGLSLEEWVDPYFHLMSESELYRPIEASETNRARLIWHRESTSLRAHARRVAE